MNSNDSLFSSGLRNLEQDRERRQYVRPLIVHREPVESVAADCSIPGGKGDPTCGVGFS
ncbi:MAG: hypothetical protein AAGN66_16805 [Acidobacteriota bacterium]